ncbi:MAG: efflux RND transporter periplasmic adaptor subunit [Candidatus Saccharibacteria bacterium]
MKIVSNQTIRYILFIIVGLFLGWLFFHSSSKAPVAATEQEHVHSADEAKAEVWTCSMHPQIRMDKPGKCPICGMDLIPLSSMSAGADAMAVHLTKEAAQLANVMTSAVSSQAPAKEIRLYGKVQADERLLQSQVTYLAGRIEKLLVNFTGEPVRKGQPLAVIYSPDLVTAQQELIEAARTKDLQPEIYEAALEKLRQWKLSDKQIASIESSGKVQPNMEITSNANGIVTARRVNMGDYVGQGSVLYEVADLSRVWILFDAYESDLAFLQRGNTVEFTLQALPGNSFTGKIAFIDPVIDPVNRVAKVRVEMSNPGGKLKPEMFATGSVKANIDQFEGKLVVPRSAVLWTGKRSVVYVKSPGDEPIFTMRQIEVGPMLGNSYVVTDGLKEGEEIVTEGAFSVDAAAQLEGKPSMMNQEGGTAPAAHDHGTMAPGQSMSSASDHTQFKVLGNCDMCKERIETAAKSVAGVSTALWSTETKILQVHYDSKKTDGDAIQKAVANVGHDTEKFKAPEEAYKKLPECCLYTR